ncbi:MAG: hypothetical protein ACTSVV_17510 [Promethearchaeota archaeon]
MKNRKKTISIFLIFFLTFVQGIFFFPIFTRAEDPEISIKEGDKLRWEITDIERSTENPEEKGDILEMTIDAIEYYEKNKTWVVLIQILDFSDDNIEDLPIETFIYIYGDPKKAITLWDDMYIIPSNDIENYLKDIADASNSHKYKDGKLIINTTSEETIELEYNDLGVLEKYTKLDKDDKVILEFQLQTGIISFGFHYIYFIIIGMAFSLIIIIRKKWRTL